MYRIVSREAQTSYGSARYKTVTHLTKEERAAARSGVVLVMTGCPKTNGITSRELYEYAGRFYHRMPSPELLAELRKDGVEE